MKSFVQKHGKLLISVAVALMVAAACMGTLMQNKQTRSLVGAWMIYDGYDGGDLAPNVLVFAADGTGIGYALDSDGLDNGMENILLPRERLSDAQPFHWQQSGKTLTMTYDAGDTRQLEIGISPMGNTRELSLTLRGLGGGWIPVTIAEKYYFQIHLRHLLAPFPFWRPLIPLSVALLRCVSFTLARMKNSRRILAHSYLEIV